MARMFLGLEISVNFDEVDAVLAGFGVYAYL